MLVTVYCRTMASPGSARRPSSPLRPEDIALLDDDDLQQRIEAIDREMARLRASRPSTADRRAGADSDGVGGRTRGSRLFTSPTSRFADDWTETPSRAGPARLEEGPATPAASVRSMDSPSGRATEAVGQPDVTPKRTLATIKLGGYNGSTPLETHLAKMENCAVYYNWTTRDRLCHLKASLEGDAGVVLWELNPESTEADVIKLLQNRFGNVNQVERYRTELRMRRRGDGESIQAVYQDIRRLLALGFPGRSGELLEIFGRDAFLNALGDENLRQRVLDQRPQTLDDVLARVCEMESYTAPAQHRQAATTAGDGDYSGRKNVRWASSATASAEPVKPRESSAENKRIQQLEAEMRQLRADLNNQNNARLPPPPAVAQPPPMVAPPQWYGWPPNPGPAAYPQGASYQQLPLPTPPPEMTSSGRTRRAPSSGQRRRIDHDTCARCFSRGHWKNECPLNSATPTGTNNADNPPYQFRGVSSSCVFSETYLDLDIARRRHQALIDSGADRSLIPRRMVPNAILSPCDVELFAANGTKISVLGRMQLNFNVQGLSLSADVLVSEDVDEFMLGYNFLAQNNCHWFFDQGVLVINGKSVKLKQRPARSHIRRVYVRETISIPADTQINVPVRLPLSNFHAPKCDWLVEAREVRPGLMAARTLLSDSDEFSAVRFVNVSGKTHELKGGFILGKAEPGVSWGTWDESRTGSDTVATEQQHSS